MNNGNHTQPVGELEAGSPIANPETQAKQRRMMIGIGVGAVFVLAILVGFIVLLATSPAQTTEKVRDIFIIFMALEFLVIGFALVILIIQLATLINLLQNEVKPILESTNQTASTLRGTAVFLSENLTEPVIQLNSYIAALRRLVELLGLARKK
jgi:hypothetical protein